MSDPVDGYQSLSGHGAVSRWRVALNNRLPLLGGAARRQAARELSRLAAKGNQAAVWVLAQAVDEHFDADVRALAKGCLTAIPQTGIRTAWTVWARTRGASLWQILQNAKPAHGAPDEILTLSLLALMQMAALQPSTPGMVEALVQYTTDRDAVIATRARFAIAHLTGEKGIAALCQRWVTSRSASLLDAIIQAGYQPDTPLSAAVLVALKMNRLERVTNGSEAVVALLLTACSDADEEINARARFCLLNLQKQEAIDALCAEWAAKRSPVVEKMVLQAGYVARQPVSVRLLTALKLERMDVATSIQPEELSHLLTCRQDADQQIANLAENAARHLQLQATRDRVCEMVIQEDAADARKIALDAGYLPADSAQRAAFLFLTNQIDAYDALDYDRRLLNAVYETAAQSVRQRIIRRIQQSGRQDFLTILAGADYRSRASRMTPIESQLIVQMLAANHEWERLWALAQELSLEFAVEIIRQLSGNNWQPEEPHEQAIFATLANLASRELMLKPAELAHAFPPAVQRATLKVHGRVNDLAFSPSGTLLAIGTGSRRAAIWDCQHAQLLSVYKGFEHSIGNVTYTAAGRLCCAERASSGPCGVYTVSESGPVLIGQHSQPVTALEPWREEMILSAGKDRRVVVWDTARAKLYHAVETDEWPRSICVSSECDRAATLDGRLNLFALPDLSRLPAVNYPWARGMQASRGVLRCAAYLPGSTDLLVGQYNGYLIHYQHTPKPVMRPVSRFPASIEGIRMVPGHPLMAAAGSNGEVRFFGLPDLKLHASVSVPASGRLTSLHISPDGSFMATGSSDSSMTLWDLRVLDIPEIFTRPLATSVPGQIPAVLAMAEYPDLPEALRNAIRILGHLLQLRFRYDIQVSEIPTIPVGEYDVIIDE